MKFTIVILFKLVHEYLIIINKFTFDEYEKGATKIFHYILEAKKKWNMVKNNIYIYWDVSFYLSMLDITF